MIEFEVKSCMDKVENDFNAAVARKPIVRPPVIGR